MNAKLATTPEATATRNASVDRPPRASFGSVVRSRAVEGSISFVAFIALFIFYAAWLGERFTNAEGRTLDIHQNVPILLLGLAVLVTLLAGQFDLSVASVATLTTFLAIGLSVKQGWPFGLVLVFCLVTGLAFGALNGLLVVKVGINTFIATLGTGGIALGLSSVYSGGIQIFSGSQDQMLPGWFTGLDSLGDPQSSFPPVVLWVALAVALSLLVLKLYRVKPARLGAQVWGSVCGGVVVASVVLFFVFRGDQWVNSVSWLMGLLLLVAILVWLLLDHTTYGRNLRAVGSNAEAARLAGVNPRKETAKAFMLGGVLSSSAGIALAASQGTASPGAAIPFLLPAFAAAFLSTVTLSSGRFHVGGTMLGGIFLVWVNQGLILGGLPFTWTEVVNGAVIIGAVAFSSVLKRKA